MSPAYCISFLCLSRARVFLSFLDAHIIYKKIEKIKQYYKIFSVLQFMCTICFSNVIKTLVLNLFYTHPYTTKKKKLRSRIRTGKAINFISSLTTHVIHLHAAPLHSPYS